MQALQTRMRTSGAVAQRPAAPARQAIKCYAGNGQVVNRDKRKSEQVVSDTVGTNDIKGKQAYCRCWRSGTFPMCNGAHNAHNTETGDNAGPLYIQKEEVKSSGHAEPI